MFHFRLKYKHHRQATDEGLEAAGTWTDVLTQRQGGKASAPTSGKVSALNSGCCQLKYEMCFKKKRNERKMKEKSVFCF